MKLTVFLTAIVLSFVPSTFASTCASTTDCAFTFDIHNTSFGGITSSGPYGTVEFTLSGTSILVDIDMLSNYVLVDTGFPGSFGYNATVGSITAGSFSSSAYSGSANNGGNEAADLHFDGFGYFDDAAATSGPHPGSSSTTNELDFTLTRTGGFSSVQQLIEVPTGGGDGSPYFVADVFDKACGASGGSACTGLVGVSNLTSATPEPNAISLVSVGVLAGAFFFQRRRRAASSEA